MHNRSYPIGGRRIAATHVSYLRLTWGLLLVALSLVAVGYVDSVRYMVTN